MWKVTNKMKDVRKFWDGKLGRDVLVEPKQSVLTNSPPEENDTWKVEPAEKTEEPTPKPKSKKMEVDKE
jgi:hypothetical protein